MSRASAPGVDRARPRRRPTSSRSSPGYTELRRQGARFTGPVPVPRRAHAVASRSIPAEKLYYCFGCQAGGDVFRFLQEKEGLEFREAVEQLADRYGVELAFESTDPRRGASAAAAASGCYELLAKTAALLRALPVGVRRGREGARATWRAAGSAARCSSEFGVGFAPSAWDRVLTSALAGGLHASRSCTAAGLAQRGRRGGFYDRFRGADHVPAARRPRPGARLRRARDARQPAAEVRELARERRLPQGPLAVRPRPRPPARDQARAR